MTQLKKLLYHPYFILAIIVLTAFWPLTFQQYVIPHDMINCWIPWRHFISDSIQNGQFPWWNPYQQMGYPIHADLQGPTWHIESLFASMLGRQGPVYIQYAFLGYLWIGAVGFYKMAGLFSSKNWIRLIVAVSYICSGFFIGHSMHFFAIISAAFVPHIIYHVIQLLDKGAYTHGIIAAIFIFFNLTGGYQTFTILLIYLLFPVAVYYGILKFKTSKAAFKRFLLSGTVFVITSLGLASVIVAVYIQFKPYLKRLSHLPFDQASQFPFSPKSSFSFINPMVPINETDWIETNLTMSNSYFGLLFLLLFFISFFRKRTTLETIILIFGIFCFICSLGVYTPVYEFVYNYFPLLGKFRFPAYFCFFFMLSALILGIKTLEEIFYDNTLKKRLLLIISCFLGLVLISSIIFGLTISSNQPFWLSNGIEFTDLSQNFIYYGIFQLLILAGITWAIFSKKKLFLIAIVCLDLMISLQPHLQAQQIGTVKPSEIEHTLTVFNLEVLPLQNPVNQNQFFNHYLPHLWQNVNYLDKRVGFDGFNSNYFTALWELRTSYKALSANLFENPFVYLSDEIVPYSELLKDTSIRYPSSTVFVNDIDLKSLSHIKPTNDSTSYLINTQFKITDIRFLSKVNQPYVLNLLQSYYPGWKVYVDGVDTPILKTNAMFMSIPIPAGEHDVVFIYDNKTVKIAAIISYSIFGLLLILLTVIYLHKNKKNAYPFGIMWIVIGSILIFYFFGN